MISNLIVLLTLFMGGAFALLYLSKPSWRARVEQPKHCFHEQLQRYDRQARQCFEDNR